VLVVFIQKVEQSDKIDGSPRSVEHVETMNRAWRPK